MPWDRQWRQEGHQTQPQWRPERQPQWQRRAVPDVDPLVTPDVVNYLQDALRRARPGDQSQSSASPWHGISGDAHRGDDSRSGGSKGDSWSWRDSGSGPSWGDGSGSAGGERAYERADRHSGGQRAGVASQDVEMMNGDDGGDEEDGRGAPTLRRSARTRRAKVTE